MRFKLTLVMICITSFANIKAQKTNQDIDIIIEKLTEDIPDAQKQSLILELYDLTEHPVNINNEDINILANNYIITQQMVLNIKEYKKKNGNFISIYELKLVNGFTPQLIKQIAPFIIVTQPKERTIKLNSKVKNDIIIKSQRTYKTPKEKNNYLGDNWKYSLRYKIKLGKQLEAGMLGEKDAGEQFFKGNQKNGFDFYSAYLQLKTKGCLNQINIGDFTNNWGQGLISWNSFSMGKSSYSIIRGNSSVPLKKYNSTDENNYYRGIALNYSISSNLSITPFFSNKKRDAKIIKQTTEINDTILLSDLVNTGYHRNQIENIKKNKAKEIVYGTRLELTHSSFTIALNYLKSRITPPIAPSTSYWQTYYLSGKENINMSIDYKFSVKNIYFFGESAICKNKAQAHIIGANSKPTNNTELSLIYRNYAIDYQSMYAKGFGEYSDTKNEKGLYIGFEAEPINKIKINAYFDYYKFPYKRYCINNHGRGIDYLINLGYIISDKLNLQCKYKCEIKPKNLKLEKVITTPKNIKQSLRFHININPSTTWEFRSRFELSNYKHKDINDKGYLAFHDIFYNTNNSALKTQLRFTYFKTDSYYSRIYTYENDLLYSFYSPALFYKGYRTFINTKLRLSKSIYLNCKYALSNYKNLNDTEAKAKKKSEIKLLLRIKI